MIHLGDITKINGAIAPNGSDEKTIWLDHIRGLTKMV